ncbi:MAG: cytochrome c oxidase assembly protein [Acetobacteraceae bacterium]|nr:cytochrome c oxidase assembly protein [Acetobacteraceae bacterium]
MDTRRANRLTAAAFITVALGMVGLSFAAIPLYRMFCAATGYGGTPKIGVAPAPGGNGYTIRVRFNADTNPGLPWTFAPDQLEVVVPVGEDHLAAYTAHNKARTAVTGVAVYNVTPEKAAKYFHKTACFCFNQQTLEGGQTMDFPLSFWVDPAISTDPNTKDVKVITLSYTFFRSLEDADKAGALTTAGPHAGSPANTN